LATKKGATVVDLKADAADREDLVSATNRGGQSYVRRAGDGKTVYLSSTKQPSDPLKEGPYTQIDALEIGTGKRTVIFKGRTDVFESPTMLDDEGTTLIVSRQTSTTVPNSFLVRPKDKVDTRITDNRDYSPDLTNLRRETIIVTRQDGLKFQVKVTFPAWATYGVKLPAFFWFYPNEFTSQEAYDKSKRAANRNLFRQVTGNNKEILARAGYVVVEPDCPIVGPAGKMNDEYIPQLRNNLLAVIDELDRRGWVDRSRLGIGGHSYGAFSTVNALVNTPFFKAGIAGDGCYNRTLTPFGFQSEQRQIWEDRDMYLEMSPFLKAEQMTGALLMYHGMEDQNIGTAPINSERMYAAVDALGKPAALYMYPYEDHGQIARETVLDQWARFVAWLDKWVKNPPAPVFPLQKDPITPSGGTRRGRG
jgi:dipeptidyl aminopeptidase/acylaminoacyl peptidase